MAKQYMLAWRPESDARDKLDRLAAKTGMTKVAVLHALIDALPDDTVALRKLFAGVPSRAPRQVKRRNTQAS